MKKCGVWSYGFVSILCWGDCVPSSARSEDSACRWAAFKFRVASSARWAAKNPRVVPELGDDGSCRRQLFFVETFRQEIGKKGDDGVSSAGIHSFITSEILYAAELTSAFPETRVPAGTRVFCMNASLWA